VSNYLAPWSAVPLEKTVVPHPVNKCPTSQTTWPFITVFTKSCYLSLSWDRQVYFMPFLLLLYCTFNTVLPLMPRSSKCPLSFRFHHQIPVRTSLRPHVCHKSCSNHPTLLDDPNTIWLTSTNKKAPLSPASSSILLLNPSSVAQISSLAPFLEKKVSLFSSLNPPKTKINVHYMTVWLLITKIWFLGYYSLERAYCNRSESKQVQNTYKIITE
jgi:hypothetical protein